MVLQGIAAQCRPSLDFDLHSGVKTNVYFCFSFLILTSLFLLVSNISKSNLLNGDDGKSDCLILTYFTTVSRILHCLFF